MLQENDFSIRTPPFDTELPKPVFSQPDSKRSRYFTLAGVLTFAALLMACSYFHSQASKYHEWYISESHRSDSIAAVNQQLQFKLEQLNDQVISRKTSSRLTHPN